MIIIARIEVSEQQYRKAIADAWREGYGERLAHADIKITDSAGDFREAVRHIPTDAIKEIRITK